MGAVVPVAYAPKPLRRRRVAGLVGAAARGMLRPMLQSPVISDGLALLIAAASVGWATAWCGRKLGLPGFVLPLAAGLLMGPGVLGRLAPELHQSFFAGGATQQRELADRQSHYDDQLQRLRSTGVTEEAVIEYQQKIDGELDHYRQAVVEAQARRDEARRLLAWSAVGLTLMGLGARTRVGRLFPTMREAMPLTMSMLLCVAILAAVGATLLGKMQPGAGANLWFAGLMLGGMSAMVPASRRLIEALRGAGMSSNLDDRPQLLEAAGLMVMLTVWVALTLVRPPDIQATLTDVMATHIGDALAAGVLIVAALFIAHPWLSRPRKYRGDATPAAAGLAIAGIGYFVLELHPAMLAWLIGLTLGVRQDGGNDDAPSISRQLIHLAGPVAMVMVGWQVDVVSDFDAWPALAVLIVFGDGKGLGMLLSLRWFAGRSWTEALGMGAAAGAGGMLPVLFAFVLYESRVIDGPLMLALALANIICGALARPMLKIIPPRP